MDVATRDLKDHLSEYLKRVQAGEEITITSHGKPVAKLSPPDAVKALKGCVIRLSDSENDEYELEGSEIVSIEDGYLYYDGPDSGAEMAPGSKAWPPSSQPADPGAPNK